MSAQHLGDGQDQVGGCGPLGEPAGQFEPDHPWDEHGDRLPQHGGLGLDAADPPSDHAESVDHGGVGIGADAGVGVGLEDTVDDAREDDPRQVFDVDLMDYAGARGHHLEIIECGLTPAQELVALSVALVFDLGVPGEGSRGSEHLGYDGVVDDHFRRGERVHFGGVSPEGRDRLPHGREIHHAGHTREVLHDDAGGGELNLVTRFGSRVPVPERPDVVGGDVDAVLRSQQVLQKDLEAVGQPVVSCHRVDPEDLVGGATHLEG